MNIACGRASTIALLAKVVAFAQNFG